MVCRVPSRTQYRRECWEEQKEPRFAATVTLPIVPPDVFDGIPDEVLPVVKKHSQRFHLPIQLPANMADELCRTIYRVVYQLRHSNRLRLRMDGDDVRDGDLAGSIENILRAYNEEMLAARGHRSAAHGISKVVNADGSIRWRAQCWGQIGEDHQQIRTGHIHVGYADSEEKAKALLEDFWLKQRGINIYVCRPVGSAIKEIEECLQNASQNCGDKLESQLAELPDDEDEPETVNHSKLSVQFDAAAELAEYRAWMERRGLPLPT